MKSPSSKMVLVVLFLSGCAAPSITPEQLAAADCGPYPDNYQQIIKDFYQQRFKDPESARYRFSQPVKGVTFKPPVQGGGVDTYGWAVDVWINAKNSFGGYTGEQHHRILIRDGVARLMMTDEELDRMTKAVTGNGPSPRDDVYRQNQ